MVSASLPLDRFVRGGKNFWLARVELALDAFNDPVTLVGRHLTFKRWNQQHVTISDFDQLRRTKLRNGIVISAVELNSLDHYWLFPELHRTFLEPSNYCPHEPNGVHDEPKEREQTS